MSGTVVPLHKEPTPDPEPEAGPVTELTVVPDPPAAPPVPLWVRSGRTVRAAVTHENTRTAARAMARHSLYLAGGARIVARRTWDGRTAARYERMLRAAEAAGNHEAAAEWEERGQRYREARHRRRMDLLHSPLDAAKGVGISAGMGVGGLVLLGVAMAIATKDPGEVVTPLMAVVRFIDLMVTIVRVVWGPAITIGPFLALLALWSVGAHQHAAPSGPCRPTPAPVRANRSHRRSWSRPCATSACPRCVRPSRRWATPAPPCCPRSRSPGAASRST